MTPRPLIVALLAWPLAAALASGGSAAGEARVVMMASTIGPIDAGIVAALEEAYFRRTGVIVSDEAQRIIQAFEVDRYGEPLFFPNSDDWRKRHGGAS